jgi:hypothetical protein
MHPKQLQTLASLPSSYNKHPIGPDAAAAAPAPKLNRRQRRAQAALVREHRRKLLKKITEAQVSSRSEE